MKVEFSRRATEELRDIAAYLKPRSPQGAKRVRAAIITAITRLADFPRLGTPQTVPGVYKHITRRYPYLIYYTIDVDAGVVYIITIRHGARQLEYDDA
jgi:toxin ParE1/3/4